MAFYVDETGEQVEAVHRPVVVITSNNEKELPDAFLRRCIFHYIAFPERELMADIVAVHFPELGKDLLEGALRAFYRLRKVEGLRKRPSTSELLDWIAALVATGVDPASLSDDVPFLGSLLKREQDFQAVTRTTSRRNW